MENLTLTTQLLLTTVALGGFTYIAYIVREISIYKEIEEMN